MAAASAEPKASVLRVPGQRKPVHDQLASVPRVLPRRLPLIVDPLPDESLPSWVDRLAARLDLPRGTVALALGLQVRERASDVRPVLFGITPTAVTTAALASSALLTADEVRMMHLARFCGTALDLRDVHTDADIQPALRGQWAWALFHGSRACPRCLDETGNVWPVWWRLGVAAACPVHSLIPVDLCPSCGVRLRRGSAGRTCGLSQVTKVDPFHCGNTIPGKKRCQQNLHQIPAAPAPDWLVTAQQRVLHAANGGESQLAGIPVAAAQWFESLRFVAGVARFALDQQLFSAYCNDPVLLKAFTAERHHEGSRNSSARRLFASPHSAARAACLLRIAIPVLDAPSEQDALALLEPLAKAFAARKAGEGRNPLRALASPLPLSRMLEQATPIPTQIAGQRPGLVATATRTGRNGLTTQRRPS